MTDSTRLTDMRIDKVSLVDKGANERRFAVLKQDDSADGERNLIQKVLDAIDAHLKPVPVDPVDEAQAVVEQAPADIEKAGRKISGKRLSAIKTAMSTLYDIVEEVEPGWWTPPGGSISKENDEMTEDQKVEPTIDEKVEEAVTKALASEAFQKGLAEAVQKAMPTPEPAPAPAPEPEAKEPAEDEVTLDTVAEAVVELSKRMDGMGRSTRKSIDGQDGAEPVRKSALTGILQ